MKKNYFRCDIEIITESGKNESCIFFDEDSWGQIENNFSVDITGCSDYSIYMVKLNTIIENGISSCLSHIKENFSILKINIDFNEKYKKFVDFENRSMALFVGGGFK